MSRSGRFEPMGGWGFAGSQRGGFDNRPTAAEINWMRAGREWPIDVARTAMPAAVEVVPVLDELGIPDGLGAEVLQAEEL